MKTGTPVVLCVGSDKIPGDSIGPVVGDYLTRVYNTKCFVYGICGNSVNGTNLGKYMEILTKAHSESAVIAVDACLASGKISADVLVREGGVNPKKAVSGDDSHTGDVGILGVIKDNGLNPLSALMTVSTDKVENIARKIAFIINSALSYGI